MTPREIVARAWAITKKERQLRHWGYSSALLQTLLNVKLITYQSWFFYLYVIKGETISFFAMEELFLTVMSAGAAWTLIITIFAMILIELVYPHFAKGAIIGLAAKAHLKQEVKGGLVLAIYNFGAVFVAHEVLVLSSLTTVITIGSLMIRYGPTGDLLWVPIGMLIFLWIFSCILKFLAAFAEEAIVIHKMGPFEAIGRSIKLILSHLGHVFFLFLLLFVISMRILLNVAMVVVIPAVVIGTGLLLTQFLSPALSYSIGGVIGLVLVAAASYFFAYLMVFKQTVWTITYLELSSMKDLDIIEEATKDEKAAEKQLEEEHA